MKKIHISITDECFDIVSFIKDYEDHNTVSSIIMHSLYLYLDELKKKNRDNVEYIDFVNRRILRKARDS